MPSIWRSNRYGAADWTAAQPNVSLRNVMTTAERAEYVRSQLPQGGLFAGHTWRIAPAAFSLPAQFVSELEVLGERLLAFYRACNTLYRHSLTGRQPSWVAQYLDAGKPARLLALARQDRIRSHLPRVIRPDLLLTEDGFVITELDSVPGGIGLTGWLGKTYGELGENIVGGPTGMMEGFSAILGQRAVVVVSEESATYRPEMRWLGQQCGFGVLRPEEIQQLPPELMVYRFFELFDVENVPHGWEILAGNVTPPPKPQLEEKMLLAFLWLPQLERFWREHLGEVTLNYLRRVIARTWIVDPTPLPPHAVIPELGINDWSELARFSQKQRELVLKISGFHERAWGARGVYVGHDLSAADWWAAVSTALASFPSHPFVLQRFVHARRFVARYFDFAAAEQRDFVARARLCPYYFVVGQQTRLGGVLATLCPADKKILHGMPEAVLAPCSLQSESVLV